MGSSRFGLNVADEESKCIPHKFPRPHWPVKDDRSLRNREIPVGDNGWSETPSSGLLVTQLKH